MEDLQNIIDTFKPIFIFLDVCLAIGLIYSLYRSMEFRPHFEAHGMPKQKKAGVVSRGETATKWQEIKNKFSGVSPEIMKTALVEADKFIDEILQLSGLEGETMAVRLEKLAPSNLSTLAGVWRSHRLRNEIVHTPDFDISEGEANQALQDYEAFLKEIKLL